MIKLYYGFHQKQITTQIANLLKKELPQKIHILNEKNDEFFGVGIEVMEIEDEQFYEINLKEIILEMAELYKLYQRVIGDFMSRTKVQPKLFIWSEKGEDNE